MSYLDMVNFMSDKFQDGKIVSMMCSSSDIPIHYAASYRKPTAIYHKCNWCGTFTEKTDSRGNCINCGHPFEVL